jgi:alkaline phosphatase
MEFDKKRNAALEPSIKEMTETAIKILERNPNGFYLLVEGGLVTFIEDLQTLKTWAVCRSRV